MFAGMLQCQMVFTIVRVSFLIYTDNSSFHYNSSTVFLPGNQALTSVCLTSNVITIGFAAFYSSPLSSIFIST
jgi:hypothetical protein